MNHALSITAYDVEPGSAGESAARPVTRDLRLSHVFGTVLAGEPDLRYYQRLTRARGSRRRGRRASWLHAADCLSLARDPSRPVAATFTLRLGREHLFLLPVPVAFVDAKWGSSGLPLSDVLVRADQDVHLAVDNRDTRVVTLSLVITGSDAGVVTRRTPPSYVGAGDPAGSRWGKS